MTDYGTWSDLALWSFAWGSLSPLVVAVAQQPRWPAWARSLVNVAASAVGGVAVAALSGQLDGKSATTAALVVLASSIATYEGLWKHTGATRAIESATSAGATAAGAAPNGDLVGTTGGPADDPDPGPLPPADPDPLADPVPDPTGDDPAGDDPADGRGTQ